MSDAQTTPEAGDQPVENSKPVAKKREMPKLPKIEVIPWTILIAQTAALVALGYVWENLIRFSQIQLRYLSFLGAIALLHLTAVLLIRLLSRKSLRSFVWASLIVTLSAGFTRLMIQLADTDQNLGAVVLVVALMLLTVITVMLSVLGIDKQREFSISQSISLKNISKGVFKIKQSIKRFGRKVLNSIKLPSSVVLGIKQLYIPSSIFVIVILSSFVFSFSVAITDVVAPQYDNVRVVAATPYNSQQEVTRDTQITLNFSESISETQIAERITIEPEIDFTASVEDKQVTLTPNEDLAPDTEYKITIDDNGVRESQRELRFTTQSHPSVVFNRPKVLAEPDQDIVVSFSKPVVSLTSTGQNVAADEIPVQISPAIEGTYTWIAPTTLTFTPKGKFDLKQDYQVTVIADRVVATDELQMQSDFSWTITKQPLEILTESIDTNQSVNGPIAIDTNAPVKLDSASVVITGEGETIGTTLTNSTKDGIHKLVIRPETTLVPGTNYSISIPAELQSSRTLAPIGELKTISFNTRDYPLVELAGEIESLAQPTLKFSEPMDTPSVIRSLTFNGNAVSADDLHWIGGSEVTILKNIQPSTDYNIKLTKGAKSVDGLNIQEAFNQSYRTKDLEAKTSLYGPETFTYHTNKPVEIWIESLNNTSLNYKLYSLQPEDLATKGELAINPATNLVDIPNLASRFASSMITSWSQDLSGSFDQNFNKTNFVVTDITDRLSGQGIYLIIVNDSTYKIINYSDLVISLQRGLENGLVWVVNTRNGEVVEDVEIFNKSGQKLGETNGRGVLLKDELAGTEDVEVISARKGNLVGHVVTTWNSGIETGVGNGSTRPYAGHIFTDRTLYRTGDTVYFKGYVREWDNDKLSFPAAGTEVEISISESFAAQTKYQVNAKGEFDGSFVIPDGLEGTTGGLGIENSSATRANFAIEDFSKNTYEVTVNAPEVAAEGEKVTVTVKASYYTGTPVVGANVDWNMVLRQTYIRPPSEYRRYSFSSVIQNQIDPNSDIGSRVYKSGTATTNSNGVATITFNGVIAKGYLAQMNSLDITVQDPTYQSVTAAANVRVTASKTILGTRTNAYSYDPGSNGYIEMVSLNGAGTPVSKNIKIEKYLVETTYNSFKDEFGFVTYDYDTIETLQSESNVTTGPQGQAVFNFSNPNPGEYLFKFYINNKQLGQEYIYVYDRSRTVPGYTPYESHYLEIEKGSSDEYSVGAPARLFYHSDLDSHYNLVTIGVDSISDYDVIKVDSPSYDYRLRVEDYFVPTMQVRMTLVQAGGDYPELRAGSTVIRTKTNSKILSLKLGADKAGYGPGDKVNIRVTSRNVNGGLEGNTTLTAAVVDKALLDLASYERPDIIDSIFPYRYSIISASHTLTTSFYHHTKDLDFGNKGGGGGGGGGDNGLFDELDTRKDFKDTALWLTDVTTGSDGKGTISFELPDNLTTWVVLVKGAKGTELFGESEISIVSSLDFQLLPTLPRFLQTGDTVRVGTTIVNSTNQDRTMTLVTWTNINDPEGKELSRKEVTIKAGGSEVVRTAVKVSTTNPEATVKFALLNKSGRAVDSVEETIKVNQLESFDTFGYAGTLTDVVTESLELLPGAESMNAEISLSSNPVQLRDTDWTYMANYEYQCSEQTSSKLLSHIAGLGLGYELNESYVNSQLERLLELESDAGGWGWWEGESIMNVYNTAYALIALHAADTANVGTLDLDLISRATQSLRGNVNNEELDGIARSVAAYALALWNEIGQSDLIGVYNQVAESNDYSSKALVMMAMQEIDFIDYRYQNLLEDIESGAFINASTVNWEPDFGKNPNQVLGRSRYLSTLLPLMALAGQDPQHTLLLGGANWINTAVPHTTHDRAWALYAAATVSAGFADRIDVSETYSIAVQDTAVCEPCTGSAVTLSETQLGDMTDIQIKNESNGPLYYYTRVQQQIAPDAIEARSSGYSINREYENISSGSTANVKGGHLVKVTLTVVAEQGANQILIEDHIPAGFEIVNFNLATENPRLQDLLEDPFISTDSDSYLYLQQLSPRERILSDKMSLLVDYMPEGVYQYEYLMRASILGEFNAAPATVENMYYPEEFGSTAVETITIKK